MTTDQEPSNAEVQQYEQPGPIVVPVTIEGPVRTQELPSVIQGIGAEHLDTAGKRILANDPRRKAATVISLDQDLILSHSQAGLVSGAPWPKLVPLIFTTRDAVWASSATATTRISIIIEGWAQ